MGADWHTHPGGQALFIVSGNGRVQRDDGETVRVGPGDTVYAPPGERHWHGATEDSFMVHLSITAGGPTAWEAEKVSDADYARNR
jgi:quercetin dioxygenase-like cupin family protein